MIQEPSYYCFVALVTARVHLLILEVGDFNSAVQGSTIWTVMLEDLVLHFRKLLIF